MSWLDTIEAGSTSRDKGHHLLIACFSRTFTLLVLSSIHHCIGMASWLAKVTGTGYLQHPWKRDRGVFGVMSTTMDICRNMILNATCDRDRD
ncbi:Uncharacterized protein HZ326_0922 [Fusarium oxysporum f. sp. albedinis]|nr:Uncharacterized protein HZ326_0922 [Fusarium oxysporum f. sp. albedinis]